MTLRPNTRFGPRQLIGACALALLMMLLAGQHVAAQTPNFTKFDTGLLTPVLSGGPPGSWDEIVREKVWVIQEGSTYKMWYVGHTPVGQSTSKVGYATSTDGITWTKHPGNPVINRSTQDQDISVVRTASGAYYMYIEVNNAWIDLMTSTDGINWVANPTNPVRNVAASPVVWQEGANWFMLYEEMQPPQLTIHLATSPDGITWTDSPSNPVLADADEVIPDSVIKEGSTYHLYYHRSDFVEFPVWHATSTNLTSWTNRERLYFGYTSPTVIRRSDNRLLMYLWDLEGDGRFYLRYDGQLPVQYHWRFDDGAGGIAIESTQRGYNGVLRGPAWTTGRVGGALNFDGVDDELLTSFARDMNTWTVAAWVRGNAAPSSAAASGPVHRGTAFQLNWNHPDAAFRGAAALSIGGNWYPASFGALTGGTWYHLTATYDGDALRTYRNGVLVTTNAAPSGPPDAETTIMMFGRNSVRDNFFAGAIDEVRLYDRALSAIEVAALVQPDPTPPSSVTLSASASGQTVQLSWNAATDADSGIAAYRIYRSTTPGGTKPLLTEVSGTTLSYTDAAVVAQTTYYYQVSAVNGGGLEGALSAERSATPINAPPANPTGLSGVPANGQVALDWADNTEPDLAGYRVYRGTTSGGPYTQLTPSLLSQSAYTDTTATNGVTYYYVVRAFDSAGNSSGNSNQVTATPLAIDPGLSAYWQFEEGTGTFTADSVGSAHGTLTNGPVWTAGRVGNALQFDGSNDFVQTNFATDLMNWTVAVWVRSPAAPASGASSGPVHRNKAMQINWNHPEASFRGAVALQVNGNWFGASFGALQANTWYHLAATYDGDVLRAYRDGVLITANPSPSGPPALESASLTMGRHATAASNFFAGTVDDVRIYSRVLTASEVAGLIQTDSTPPSAPALSGSASGQNVQLSWTAASDPQSGINQYRIYRGTSSGAGKTLRATVSGSTLSYLDTGTSPSTTYFYNVTAVNGSGLEGTLSNEVSALTGNTPPAAPTGLSAIAGNAQVALDWNNNSEGDLAGYHVWRSTVSGGSYVRLTTTPIAASAYTDNTASNGVTYFYVVQAVDTGGATSGFSAQVSAVPTSQDLTLLGSWRLDETSGTVASSDVGSNHGTLSGGPVWTAGHTGGGLQFDGVNDQVVTPFNTQLNTWTIAAWVRGAASPVSGPSSGPVHRGRAFQFNWNHGEDQFRGAAAIAVNGNWYPASFGPLAGNTWYYLVATYDGETLRAYRDGVLITANAAPSGPPDADDNFLSFGRHAQANNFWAGTVDAVRLYSRVLSDAEVQTLFATQ
jgi:fibronectin type 3 domain-containing protein